MAVEALEQATTHASRDPASIRTVWATAHGEHSPAIKLLEMMHRGEGKLSPALFHNSVHNTASGYASIATQNVQASTTLTGGRELVATALLEARCLLESSAGEVAVVLADEPLQPPFERPDARTPLAIALLLSRDPECALAVLAEMERVMFSPVPAHQRFGRLHVSAVLPLLERIVLRQPGRVALELDSDGGASIWCVDLELPS